MDLRCLSCKKKIANDQGATRFTCPGCAKYEIIRCRKCREIVTQYTCPECKFLGPN